jgi:hypothetical protein
LAKLPLLVNNNKPEVFKSSRPTMTQRDSLGNKSKTLLRPTDGIELDDGFAKFSRVSVGGGQGANRWYKVVLKEGRKREVRRLWESLGFKVSRISYALQECREYILSCNTHTPPDEVVLHSLTNDLKTKSHQDCVEDLTRIITIINRKWKNTICIRVYYGLWIFFLKIEHVVYIYICIIK